ncbi:MULTISPECIES: hypothetical protein [Brevibacillus]|jgi:hypothetical protein|uniref:Transcriptional regulator n=1 Tax=Brevibacillus parabrevis TaxID=54914 RepID=A0A4Y3PKN6_BREPA|nr:MULTISPECIES: hypothetical protein [Brevibacillus]MBU8715875.1 hypothetical protein [Brevibacillus parabrevis]MDH6352523.1 hypothetical protein [Brevibacillus sp. 1238]MDR4998064.1 hypothetical protein [Brevibacillus parabrevis]MED2258141.1 hypothetical protein [Brevibacillus parabrevis]NRQ55963.1 hypothetical protein [Brevibacillus sp. HD1.4A]
MYTVGVVGPHTSVERIIQLGNEYEQTMKFIGYSYSDFQETKTIVREYDQQVDAWLFSGQISYMVAKNTLSTDEKLVYIQHTESGIYKSLLHMGYYQHEFLSKVSIDEITTSHLEQALEQIEIAPQDMYVKTFDVHSSTQELIDFHLDLYRAGKTKGALTCFEAVYFALTEAGVPAYRIESTDMEIRQALRILAEKIRTFYYKDTQIGVQLVEIEQFAKISEKAKSSYHLQYFEMKVKETLLRYCEKLDGSLLEKGNGRYVIISSRGAIEREIRELQETLQQLAKEVEHAASVGIGYGVTVHTAEINAERALQLSKDRAEHGIVIIREDGTIVQSAGDEEELSFSFRSDDKQLIEKLKEVKLSAKNYYKVTALMKRMNWNDFTIKDLATHLYWDERNARRFMVSLCEADLAECVGEEASSARGRPSKRYRLK